MTLHPDIHAELSSVFDGSHPNFDNHHEPHEARRMVKTQWPNPYNHRMKLHPEQVDHDAIMAFLNDVVGLDIGHITGDHLAEHARIVNAKHPVAPNPLDAFDADDWRS